ncbi:hypothetical protein [Roseateles koreensis]|uniref:Uncharacterized protein n=1 Tax=Roseateles koreensis TaxID=2987526 RepID=A0ABT5KT69_9BURK|nr:hypothetical protein [Roseateles koreensis]MDC8786131.1 hypothetical protein [Roseateles koreensis]
MGQGSAGYVAPLRDQALSQAKTYTLTERILPKQAQRVADEALRPLAETRKDELSRMYCNFYGFDPSNHVACCHFVHKPIHVWTPRHLALHR